MCIRDRVGRQHGVLSPRPFVPQAGSRHYASLTRQNTAGATGDLHPEVAMSRPPVPQDVYKRQEASPMSPTEPTKVTPRLLRDWSLPEPGSSKHLRGRVVLLGGSARTPGAVQLPGIAALRVGAGHLSLAVAAPASVGLAVATPEAGVAGLAWTRPARCCRTASRRCRSGWVRPCLLYTSRCV